ncbi:MAG: UDP-2,3-diacylglucosamine diphosphatase [Bacteroidales bacterium]|nr:UDP-2,3-diacylglucosamine diphosphatase [Bacteroidales bacterium]
MTKLAENKKIYFVSDSHFGVPDRKRSLAREKLFVKWLESIEPSAQEIFLMGDLFEFWFEYKTVIPKGYTRLFGILAQIADKGIPVSFFRGNHDVWAFKYLEEELNIQLFSDFQIREINGKIFYLAHGDGLGKGDNGYKFIKKVFRNRINQWLFKWLHPDIGTGLGYFFSDKSRENHMNKGLEKINNIGIERLKGFCFEKLKENNDINYFIFGHIHMPKIIKLTDSAQYISLGDWINYFSYAEFDGKDVILKDFKE